MSERRRSIFVLLVVAALIGGVDLRRPDQADQARPGPPGRFAARLPGGADRAAAGRSRRDAAVDRPHAGARERVRRLRGRDQPGRRRPDRGQPPGRRERRGGRRPGRLDRPAVLLRLGSEHPRRGLQDRPGPEREQPPAGRRACGPRSSRPPSARTSASARGSTRWPTTRPAASPQAALEPRFYVFNKTDQEAVQQRADLQLAPGRAGLARARTSARTPRSSRSRPACSCCAPSARPRTAPSRTAGGSSRTARASRAPRSATRSRASTRASTTSRSSPSTSRTRAARRSRRSRARSPSAAPTTRSARPPIQTSQHFAIALDNELISAPYINWQENPDGIDGATGAQISGSLHDQVRAEPGEAAQDRRAAAEADRDLALAGLRHARCPGARPGPEGRHRGLRHRRALPDPLLPRAGRRSRPSRCASTRCTSTRWSS